MLESAKHLVAKPREAELFQQQEPVVQFHADGPRPKGVPTDRLMSRPPVAETPEEYANNLFLENRDEFCKNEQSIPVITK